MKFLLKTVNKMLYYYLISGLLLLIPAFGMVSGLSAATTITIFLMVILSSAKRIDTWDRHHEECVRRGDPEIINWIATTTSWFRNDTTMSNYKLELLFASLCLLSCIFTFNPINSVITFFQVFGLLLLGLVANNCSSLLYYKSFQYFLIAGVILAIALFFIEYFTLGFLTRNFRIIFQPYSLQFNLYMLDQGCALLSIISWIIIIILINYKKNNIALFYYIFILYLLNLSDSLASLLGFIIGGLTFITSKLIIKFNKQLFFRLISTILIIGALSIPIIAKQINPEYISYKYSLLKDSAKHRLYIWHFVADKISNKPLFGYGLASSKYIEVIDNDIIKYQGMNWYPLPLHPHNNILQITFELGIVGLLLFLALIYKYLHKITAINNINEQAACYACFSSYFFIGMVSYSIWQTWWVAVGVWTMILMKLLVNRQF